MSCDVVNAGAFEAGAGGVIVGNNSAASNGGNMDGTIAAAGAEAHAAKADAGHCQSAKVGGQRRSEGELAHVLLSVIVVGPAVGQPNHPCPRRL